MSGRLSRNQIAIGLKSSSIKGAITPIAKKSAAVSAAQTEDGPIVEVIKRAAAVSEPVDVEPEATAEPAVEANDEE